MNTCILITTCEKYLDLATITIDLIHQRWKNHPPIFVCGVSSCSSEYVDVLYFGGDPKDWIGMVETASLQLLKLGFHKTYLILDDHPPLDICNDEHLNYTLPSLMDTLDAAYIGLYGWDQSTFSKGTIMSSTFYQLQRQDQAFLWRYSLHPALWRLECLLDISRTLLAENQDLANRSIWNFERRSGSAEIGTAISKWEGRSYRIFGLGMLGKKNNTLRRLIRHFFFMFTNGVLVLVKNIFGLGVQEKLSNIIMAERLFFDGPYPLYWSGVMQKGKINKQFKKFMIWRRRSRELFLFQNTLIIELD